MTRKAALFLVAVLLPPMAFHLGVWRRAAAYLLLDVALSSRVVTAVHLTAIAAGAALALRGRSLPPWRLAELLGANGVAVGIAALGVFFAFGHAASFAPFVLVSSALLGLGLGALGVVTFRLLRGLRSSAEETLSALRPELLGLGLILAVVAIALADRAGPLRVGLAASLALCLAGYLAATTLAPSAKASRRAAVASLLGAAVAGVMLSVAEPLAPWRETPRLPDPLVYARSTETTRVVLTSGRGAFQLYVDGLLRMSTIDDARRREATVLPALSAATRRAHVLVVGGGDGGSTRELLRVSDVERVTLVDADEPLLSMAREQPVLRAHNADALRSPRVRVVAEDPLPFLQTSDERFDVIVLDLLEPEGPARSKLYSAYFQRLVASHLADGGVAITTAPSPLSSPHAFWCVVTTLESVGLSAVPYRASLPTMGAAGFVLFSRSPLVAPRVARPGGTYVDTETLREMFALGADEARVPTEANLLHRQVLLRYRDQDML